MQNPIRVEHPCGFCSPMTRRLTEFPSVPARLSPRRFFRILAFAEAVTWTLLIAGMILKYGFDAGALPVRIGGSLHGFVFITYAITAVVVGLNQRWKAPRMVLAIATGVIPYATIPFDLHVDRRGLLDGPWRREATVDPRDHTLVGKLLRWLLNHPIAFAIIFIVGVVVIMSVLLFLGPPNEWGS